MPGNMERALSDLKEYGRRSATGLDAMRRAMVDALSRAPKEAYDVAEFVNPLLPGYGTLESIRLGRQASGLWNEGRYADSLDRFADALDAPFSDVLWIVPETKAYKAMMAARAKR